MGLIAARATARATEPIHALKPTERTAVRKFLREYLLDTFYSKETRYIAAAAHLHDHERDVIVYFDDQKSCGSGGCNMLILAPEGPSSYRLVNELPICKLPIRVLGSSHNGWRDIGVFVQGGGIVHGYEAVLSFDGKKYPDNPTVPPARPISHARGEIVIPSDAKDMPLYPG